MKAVGSAGVSALWAKVKNKTSFAYTIAPKNAGTAKLWLKLGTLTMNLAAATVHIVVLTGGGYNGSASQNSKLDIYVKHFNNNPTTTTNRTFGVTVEYGQRCEGMSVMAMATAYNKCDVWVYLPFTYANGSCCVSGAYSGWTPDGSTTQAETPSSGTPQDVIGCTWATTAAATQSAAGLMSASDKAKLDGISSGGGGDYLSDADFVAYVTS